MDEWKTACACLCSVAAWLLGRNLTLETFCPLGKLGHLAAYPVPPLLFICTTAGILSSFRNHRNGNLDYEMERIYWGRKRHEVLLLLPARQGEIAWGLARRGDV